MPRSSPSNAVLGPKETRPDADRPQENDPKPNPGHVAIAELEALGAVQALVTQNVDNLHQDAGSSRCIEFHGNLMECKCRRAPQGGGIRAGWDVLAVPRQGGL